MILTTVLDDICVRLFDAWLQICGIPSRSFEQFTCYLYQLLHVLSANCSMVAFVLWSLVSNKSSTAEVVSAEVRYVSKYSLKYYIQQQRY